MFSEWIRRTFYWVLDFLRGSKVRKHLNDIAHVMENPDSVGEYQAEKIKLLLDYATKNTLFYHSFASKNLSEFPVINKMIIKNQYNSFKTPMSDMKAIALHTSGSTGTPFIILQNPDKRNRVLAEMMYFWGKSGYKIGMRYVFFRIWTNKNKKSGLSAFSRNLIMTDILHLDNKKLETIYKMLQKDKQIKMLLGYASTFEKLVNYLIDNGASPACFSVETIISSSEVLTEDTRSKLIYVFGCKVVSLYSNQENGMIAIECGNMISSEGNTEFHVNEASFYIELLKPDRDEAVRDGELGRVVITDFYNYAMPIIRYDTGDMAIRQSCAKCEWNTMVLSSVEGRRVDLIYNTFGEPLSAHTWSVMMWKYDLLKQYQFIQDGAKDYTLKINVEEGIYSDEELIKHLSSILGADAQIKIEHINEIPNLASGKFKKTICNYKPAGD